MKFTELRNRAEQIAQGGAIPLVLLGGGDNYSRNAVKAARENGWVKPVLAKLNTDPVTQGFDVETTIVAENISDLLAKAVKYVRENGGMIMHGSLKLSDMLHALVMRETGFRVEGRLLTHISMVESDKFPEIKMLTDGGFLIKPSLDQKVEIVKNAIGTAHKLGIERPKVAMLAAVEADYLKMEAALDDSVIDKMGDRGYLGNAAVDGPLSVDCAIMEDVAREKGVLGEVAGHADILVAPRIEAANGLYKALFFFGDTHSAAIVAGGMCPFVLNSRAHNVDSNLNSIAVAMILNS